MGSGEGVRGTGGNSTALGRDRPRWLTHCSLARSLPPSVLLARPPAACCLLTLSLALPAFAAHAGRYVTANRRDSGEDAHGPAQPH